MDQAERVARNDATFREANERIRDRAVELEIDELAASLKFAQVKVSKIERQRGEDRGGNGPTGEANPFDDEPPF